MPRRPAHAAHAAHAATTTTTAATAVLLLVLTGCAGQDAEPRGAGAPSPTGSAESAAAPSPAPSASAPPDAEVSASPRAPASSKAAAPATPEALRWQARTVDGESFDAASLSGRPTLLWFWAPWCPSCRGQIPQVKDVAAAYSGDLDVIGVGSLDDPAAIVGFASDVPQATHLLDPDGAVWKRYGVVEQSSFILLDGNGEVVFRTGYGGADDLDERIDSLVG